MAEKKYYLWSNMYGNRKVKVGDEVTPDKLNADKEQFDEWVSLGVIRTFPHPCPDSTDVSAVEHMRRQIAAMADETQVDNFLEVVAPEYNDSAKATAAAEKESAKA